MNFIKIFLIIYFKKIFLIKLIFVFKLIKKLLIMS